MRVNLDTPIQYVKGVGPKRAEMFSAAGIRTAEDLLLCRPFRYEDRSVFRPISKLRAGDEGVVQGQVTATGRYLTPMKKVRIFEMFVSDSTGTLSVKFFNQPYLQKVFRKGQQVLLFGVCRVDDYTLGISLINPEFEILDSSEDALIHTGRIVPIYRKIVRMGSKHLRQIVFRLLQELNSHDVDPLPTEVRSCYGLPDRGQTYQQVHFPECPAGADRKTLLESLEREQLPEQRRLVFEEFFFFQMGLLAVKRGREIEPKARTLKITPRLREVIKRILPFHPTGAQKRALEEIVDDLCGTKVMSRLLQGDVGSGKTIVALQAMVLVMENGFQVAMMAPTEILAEQHHRTMARTLAGTRYRIALLSRGVKAKQKKKILARIAAGELDLVVGTHALLQEQVRFQELALVVVDEQHRFGVLQRSRLMEKGDRPDTLVMTATPIPRSLALTLYGDLDLSVIDELPPGRQPVKTVIKREQSRPEVYRMMRRELQQRRQIFVVYPLIEESAKVDLRAAREMAQQLAESVFSEYSIGLLYGRLKAEEKEGLMDRFRRGDLQILVATTVVEVGIDVPNATLMVIEHAERFGLSQLHQLRGRIGRGSHPGLCILMTGGVRSQEAYRRLDTIRKTSDGFAIAAMDLEIRGPGEFVGTRQWGLPDFRFGNIVRHRQLLDDARSAAQAHLARLVSRSNQQGPEQVAQFADSWKQRFGLFQVGY